MAEYLEIIGRDETTSERLMEIANEIGFQILSRNSEYVWVVLKTIINSGKLNPDQMVEIGNKNDDPHVWSTIIKTGRLTGEQMIKISNKPGCYYWYILNDIIKTNKLTPDELFTVAQEAAQAVQFRDGFNTPCQTAIETGMLTGDQVMEIARKANHEYVWGSAYGSGKLTREQKQEVPLDEC